MKSLVILVLVKLSSVTAQDLFTLLPDESTQGIGECEKMEDIDSCTKIDIDFDLLKAEEDFEFDGVTFKHSYTNGDEGSIQTYSYETDNYGSAVILYSEANGHSEVDGDFIFEGSVYRIDGCGEDCHLLVKLGWDTLNSNPDGEMFGPVVEDHEFDQGTPSDREEEYIYSNRALDRSSATTVTIMVYYTPEFEQEFDNPQAVIDSHIAQTNDAFIQSGIGHVQLQLLCTERIDVMDSKTDDAGARLDAFSNAKGGDVGYILNSADIAMLMTKYGTNYRGNSHTAGLAWTGSNNDANTQYNPPTKPTGWAKAGDPITFAHEVGHIFGCLHNREEPSMNGGTANEARYGYLMEGSAVNGQHGKRTIMAYLDPDWVYTDGIARYSDNQMYDGQNYRVGDSANDNQDQIRLSAPTLAGIGDESCQCGSNNCKTCRDADSRGEAYCQDNDWACTDSRYPWFAATNCQKTCGTCTPATSTNNGGSDSTSPAPVHCEWDAWGSWGSCSASCGGGTQQRSRTEGQQAENGGNACQGSSDESRNCNEDACPSSGGSEDCMSGGNTCWSYSEVNALAGNTWDSLFGESKKTCFSFYGNNYCFTSVVCHGNSNSRSCSGGLGFCDPSKSGCS